MKRIALLLGIYFFTSCYLPLFAQSNNWGLWTSIDAEKKLPNNWELNIAAQYRWKDNISVTDQIRGSADIYRKLGRFVELGAGYELIAQKNATQNMFVYRNRFRVQSRFSYNFAQFTADWRARMQLTMMEKENERIGFSFDDEYNIWVLRNRFRLRYNIIKIPLQPYISFEIFHQLFSDLENSYFQNRLTLGTNYKINNQHSVALDYILETRINISNRSIVRIGYAYSF